MATNSNRRGFLRGALDSLIEARSRQATRYLNSALLMLDDETLAANGYDREMLRKSAHAPYAF